MPNFDIIKEVNPPKSFRCEYVRGTYDLKCRKERINLKMQKFPKYRSNQILATELQQVLNT